MTVSLHDKWSLSSSGALSPHQISLRLPVNDLARIKTLENMYPSLTRSKIICDLISSALDQLGVPL